jgi:hypothetical protein
MYTIIFIPDYDYKPREYMCSESDHAIELFHVLTASYPHVYLYGEPDQHGEVELISEYHAPLSEQDD